MSVSAKILRDSRRYAWIAAIRGRVSTGKLRGPTRKKGSYKSVGLLNNIIVLHGGIRREAMLRKI
eukprot:scaffold65971_cov38-Attheya_sp.AAC.1